MRTHTLVFSGRFQPFHVGHVEVIKHLVENFDGEILIGIVNPDPDNEILGDDKNFVRFSRDKNPLNYWERYNIIKLSLEEFHLLDKIQGIVPLPRPSINLERAENYLPPKPRKFVLCKKWNDEIENWKAQKYIQNGEEVLWIPFEKFNPLVQLASGELIRSLMTLQNPGWKVFFPKKVKTFIEESGIYRKIIANQSDFQAKEYVLDAIKNTTLSKYLVEIISTFSVNFTKSNSLLTNDSSLEKGLSYFTEFGNIAENKGQSIEQLLNHFQKLTTMQEKEKRDGITINVSPSITSTNTNMNTNKNENKNQLPNNFGETMNDFQGVLSAMEAMFKMNNSDEAKEATKIVEGFKKEIEQAEKTESVDQLKKTGFKHKIKGFMTALGKYFHLLADDELIKDLKTIADTAADVCT